MAKSKRREAQGLRGIDWVTFSIFLALVGIGWLMIYTVGYGEGYPGPFLDFLTSTTVGKQTIWIGISFLIFLFTLIIDRKFWSTFAYPLYGLAMLSLVGVLIFGTEIKGATSWFTFGSFSIQPSELAKFATCLAIAAYLDTFSTDLRNFQSQATVVGLFALPMVLILLQPDAGSALIFLSFFIVLFRAGLSANYYIISLSVIALFILGIIFNAYNVILGLLVLGFIIFILNFKNNKWYWSGALLAMMALSVVGFKEGYQLYTLAANFMVLSGIAYFHYQERRARLVAITMTALVIGSVWVYSATWAFNNILEPHQQSRIDVWLRPEKCDPQGNLYNVLQSKMAIASGGMQGKGFLNGTMTKLNYVPEQSTDFIFCTVGEEQGFIGSMGIIILYLLLMLRITTLAERQRSNFAKYYAYGLAGILFTHFLINIGMTMGLLPIIGIPLPFISKGGSSLLGFTLMIGVLLKLDSNRYSG